MIVFAQSSCQSSDANNLIVTFESNGGTPLDSVFIEREQHIMEPIMPSREGYTFLGWYSDAAFMQSYNFLDPVVENLTLYAKWEVNTYNLVFLDYDGSIITSESIEYNQDLSMYQIPDHTREGYTFTGWNIEIPENMPANDLFLTATFIVYNQMEILKKVYLYNLSDMYEFDNEELMIFTNLEDRGIPYVSIEEFNNLLSNALIDFHLETTDYMNIIYEWSYDEESYTCDVLINAVENTLSFSDFSMIHYINDYQTNNLINDAQEISNIQSLGGIYYEGDLAVLIDLDDYDFDIVEEDNIYFIPLHLANLFFTGDLISVLLQEDNLYVFNDPYVMNSVDGTFNDNEIDQEVYIKHNASYLALLFDYFYGLKDYKGIDSFDDLLDNYGISATTSLVSQHTQMDNFIFDLNDMHTVIESFGYFADATPTTLIPSDSKMHDFYNEYLNLSCQFRTESVSLEIYEGVYILSVNDFTFDTGKLLIEVLVDLDPDKMIVIDLTCNTGGNLEGVLELLSYLTDDMTIYMEDSLLKTSVQRTYSTINNIVLDNPIIVITSKVTYSAANLFVSIVKDRELALIVGDKTGGGAAAVAFTLLPDYSILKYSSTTLLKNQTGAIIEEGIEPNINTGDVNTVKNILNYLVDQYRTELEVEIYNRSTINEYDIGITSEVNEVFDFIKYKVELYETGTENLLSSSNYYNEDIIIKGSLGIEITDAQLRVIAVYEIDGFRVEGIIYKGQIDDRIGFFDSHNMVIDIGNEIISYCSYLSDIDVFMFTIEEVSDYQILFNGGSVPSTAKLFDEDFHAIKYSDIVTLNPGLYYLEVFARLSRENYSIRINAVFDDNLAGTPVTLSVGQHTIPVSYDYIGDDEWLEIEVPIEILLTVNTLNNNFVYIKNMDGSDYLYNSAFMSSSRFPCVLLPGTYILGLGQPPTGIYSFDLDVQENTGEYSGDINNEGQNFGILNMGLNEIVFDYYMDADLYVLELTEDTKIRFVFNTIEIYYYQGQEFVRKFTNNTLTLTQGTHYFRFMSFSKGTFGITFSVVVEESTINSPSSILSTNCRRHEVLNL